MFIRLIKKEQSKLIKTAIKKAGSERKLSKLLKIPNASIYHYKFDQTALPIKRFNKIVSFLKINKKDIKIKEYLPQNWRQKLGGKKCVEVKKANGTFNKNIRQLKLLSSIRMKKWHKQMKIKNPEFYYKLQYKRFKKVGRYPMLITKNKLNVRNSFEKEVADFLYDNKIHFEYEPYININKKAYFPDFLIKDIIIEVTAWKHPNKSKLLYLKKKIKDYLSSNYKIIFFIPKQYRNFYKDIDYFIISDLETLKTKIMPQ